MNPNMATIAGVGMVILVSTLVLIGWLLVRIWCTGHP